MKKALFILSLLFSLQAWSTEVCVTTLFAPSGEIDGVNKQMLKRFDINLSHFVINDQKIRLYGPQDPTSVSSRSGKRVLIAEHEITKIDDVTYNLALNGKPLIRPAHAGPSWKFAFDTDFYKEYEARAYQSIMNYCLNIRGGNSSQCKQFTEQVFDAYVAPVSTEGCVKL